MNYIIMKFKNGLEPSCGEAEMANNDSPEKFRTFRVWCSMRQRCDSPYDESYKNYGGRGITYEPRWMFFKNFLDDMGIAPVGLVLDRINNDGMYSKENCRWSNRTVSNRNSRQAKLTAEKVRVIKGLLRSIRLGTRDFYAWSLIADLFSVSWSSVRDISRGRTWKEA